MRSHAMLFIIAAAAALTPLPPGINAYEVAAGTRNRPAEALAPVALRAIAAAREANVKLGEIEFPALLGEKTAFDDVDNVQICVEINKCVGCSRRWRGGRRDDQHPMHRKILISRPQGKSSTGTATGAWRRCSRSRELDGGRVARVSGQEGTGISAGGVARRRVRQGDAHDARRRRRGPERKQRPGVGRGLRARGGGLLGTSNLGSKPETAGAGAQVVVAVQPGDGGPLEDWLNLERCQPSDGLLVSVNGAFDKLRGGFYPRPLFPKLAECVDRFVVDAEALVVLKNVADKGRAGWLFRVYPEPWQLFAQGKEAFCCWSSTTTDPRPTFVRRLRGVRSLLKAGPVVA